MTSIQIRLIEYSLIVLAVIMGYLAWHHHVYEQGYGACQTAQTKAVEEGKKQYEKKSQEVGKLSDPDLRRRLCVWMRDSDLSGCLKSLTPFNP